MPVKYNTIIFVPHAKARFRKLTVSTRVLAAVAAASALVLFSAVAFGWAYFSGARRDSELRSALADNARLKTSAASLNGKIDGLSRQLSDFESRTKRLAIVAGLSETGRTGAGGPLSPAPAEFGASVDERSATLSSQLAALETQFARRDGRAGRT